MKEEQLKEGQRLLNNIYELQTHTHKFTAEQVAKWNKRQLEINFDDYERK